MRILVFGDSITQGYWDSNGGWVERLRHYYDTLQIQDLKKNDEPTIFNLGISADNSDAIAQRIRHETQARIRHDNQVLVLVQVGINDSSISHEQMSVSVDLENYRNNLNVIVSEIKDLPSKIVFVGSSACDESLTVPVFWNNIDYKNKQIKSYEDTMKLVAVEHQIPFIPVFEDFKAGMNEGKDLLTDGVHPNNAGHKLIAYIVKPHLEKLLI